MKLKFLWAILIVALVANFFMPALAEPVVEEDDNKDDATPTSEQQDLKTLTEKEKDANDKAKLAAFHLKNAEKPFVPSLKLVEASTNTTRAEERYEELAQNEQEVNDTVTEDTKEFNLVCQAFRKAARKDLLFKNKTDSLKKQYPIASEKEREVMEAHNKTRDHIEQHYLADVKKAYAKEIKAGTAKVDSLKAKETADVDMMKEVLQNIKKRLHGDDPHTQRLLASVSEATKAIHNAAKGSPAYADAKRIMSHALKELYKLNGAGDDLQQMRLEAKSLGRRIRTTRKDIKTSTEEVQEKADTLKKIAETGVVPQNATVDPSEGSAMFQKKRLVIEEVALALNVTALKKALASSSKAYKKEHNTTYAEAKKLYDEISEALNLSVAKLAVLKQNLSDAELVYKQDKRKSSTMTAAQKAMRQMGIEYGKEEYKAAMLKDRELKQQLKRAKEVLSVLKKTSDDVNNVGTEVAKIKVETEIRKSDIEIPKFTKMDPMAMEDKEEHSQAIISPLNEKLAKLVKKAMWGVNPESYKQDVKSILAEEKKEAHDAEKKTNVQASAKAILKNGKAFHFKGLASTKPATQPLNEAKHCFDGVKNFGEAGVDCGGTCPRACGYHHVVNIPLKAGVYHEVKMIPNQELANSGESEKPMMVKSLKEMLVGKADIGGHPNAEPVMNDGKLQIISHVKNSINHNRDEKIHNWDRSHESNRFKSRRRSHLRRAHRHHRSHHLRRHRHK